MWLDASNTVMYMLGDNALMINIIFIQFIFCAQWWWYQKPSIGGMNPTDHQEELIPDPAHEVRFPPFSLGIYAHCCLLLTT